jgi:SRSO17 transposase
VKNSAMDRRSITAPDQFHGAYSVICDSSQKRPIACALTLTAKQQNMRHDLNSIMRRLIYFQSSRECPAPAIAGPGSPEMDRRTRISATQGRAGLDYFEGRSWRGLHHHLVPCFRAYGFLTLVKHMRKKILSLP